MLNTLNALKTHMAAHFTAHLFAKKQHPDGFFIGMCVHVVVSSIALSFVFPVGR